MTRRPNFSRHDEAVLRGLADGLKRTEVAAFAKVSVGTVSRWLSKPGNALRVREARAQVAQLDAESYRSTLRLAAARLKHEIEDLDNGAVGVSAARSAVDGFKALAEISAQGIRLGQLERALRHELGARGLDTDDAFILNQPGDT